MSLPKISDFGQPAKNFVRIIFLIVIITIFYSIFDLGKDFLVKNDFIAQNNIKEKEAFLNELKFDFKIVKVIDGDTLEIKRLDGEKIEGVNDTLKVRLIGIDTPETVDPRRPVECFGKEASNYMKDLAYGKVAAIDFDPAQAKFDKYGRLLAYVFVKNSGTPPDNIIFINEEMIKNGYAYEYTYNSIPYKYMEPFKFFENEARANYIGLWSTNSCNGLKTPVATPPKK